jgi:WD40 repeat protein
MGAGATVGDSTGLDIDPICLPAVALVEAAHNEDRFRKSLERHAELYGKQIMTCPISGFEATAPYTRPLMLEKMRRSLGGLDDVSCSYAADQQRIMGHTQTHVHGFNSEVRSMLPLGDDATVLCAMSDGPMRVCNWREGAIVSTFRTTDCPGKSEGAVSRMCRISPDHSTIAAGDDFGFMTIWDLASATQKYETRLHERAITGLCYDSERQALTTTSADSYILIYDPEQETVISRTVPKHPAEGTGVPNVSLAMSNVRRGLLLASGADGKVRIWTRSDTGMQRCGGLNCGGVQTTQCVICPDGNHVLVGSMGGDKAVIGKAARPGGLDVFDLRKLSTSLGEGYCTSSHVGQHFSQRRSPQDGCVDLAIAPEGFESLAVCLLDGLVQVFRIESGGPVLLEGADDQSVGKSSQSMSQFSMAPSVKSHATTVVGKEAGIDAWMLPTMSNRSGHRGELLEPVLKIRAPKLECEYAYDVVGQYDPFDPCAATSPPTTAAAQLQVGQQQQQQQVKPCAVCTSGRYLYVATTSPSMNILRRTLDGESGKQEPLTLAARVVPMSSGRVPYGSVLTSVQEALERDRMRALSFSTTR